MTKTRDSSEQFTLTEWFKINDREWVQAEMVISDLRAEEVAAT